MWSSQLRKARRMEGKWTRPATEAGREFGVNNRELYKQQEESKAASGYISRSDLPSVCWEYRLGKNNNDSFCFGSIVAELLV